MRAGDDSIKKAQDELEEAKAALQRQRLA